jgi:hypothetical protein
MSACLGVDLGGLACAGCVVLGLVLRVPACVGVELGSVAPGAEFTEPTLGAVGGS